MAAPATNSTNSGYKLIVGVLSPASDYLRGFVRLLASTEVVAQARRDRRDRRHRSLARSRRASSAPPMERSARRRGVRVRVKWNGAIRSRRDARDALSRAAPQPRQRARQRGQLRARRRRDARGRRRIAPQHPGARMRRSRRRALSRRISASSAEGIVGPSQWEDRLRDRARARADARRVRASNARDAGVAHSPTIPAAQAYAAGLLTAAALAKRPDRLDEQ